MSPGFYGRNLQISLNSYALNKTLVRAYFVKQDEIYPISTCPHSVTSNPLVVV